jgi:hypothetical protein
MKASKTASITLLAVSLVVIILWQHQIRAGLERENETLRMRISQIEAQGQTSPPSAGSNPSRILSDSEARELIRLRGGVTTLRREQSELLKRLAMGGTSAPVSSAAGPASPPPVDTAWVQQVLNSAPKDQGMAAGALRGKLLRKEITNISPAELALQDELLKRQLNQTLERSPEQFADFQAGFIQSTLNIADAVRAQQIHALIKLTYEQAVADGLDISSKPATGTDEWVARRFALDRAATAQLKALFTPEERILFDRAFLGVMGVDLGGVGVDKSNYPKGFLGE